MIYNIIDADPSVVDPDQAGSGTCCFGGSGFGSGLGQDPKLNGMVKDITVFDFLY
jgi:hypothetical protein